MNKRNLVSHQDFNKICRFCLKKTVSLKPIFNATDEDTDKVIRDCLNMLVYLGDGLPEQICSVCHKKLLEYYEFWKMCHSATETLLKEILQDDNIEMGVKVEFDQDHNKWFDNKAAEFCDTTLLKIESENDIVTGVVKVDSEIVDSSNLQLEVRPMTQATNSDTRRSQILDSKNPNQKSKAKKSDMEICPVCGIKLRCLTQHMKTHFQEQNLKICDICGFSTLQKSNLQRHMHVTHVKEGEYVCKICLNVFKDLRQLNRHKKIKHQERKHPCPHCKAIFHTSFGLTKHQTIHSGEKKHVCEECGNSYRMPDSLKAHRKRHLDPTIPCTFCTKKFYTKNELRSHIGLHTGIKAFQCDLCTSAFVASSSLAAHRRKHKKDNLLPTCKLCGTQFSDRVLLRMHLNDHKKDSPFE